MCASPGVGGETLDGRAVLEVPLDDLQLAAYLLTGDAGGADIRIKKGGAVCLAFDGAPKPRAGALRWLLTPKNLRSMPAPR